MKLIKLVQDQEENINNKILNYKMIKFIKVHIMEHQN